MFTFFRPIAPLLYVEGRAARRFGPNVLLSLIYVSTAFAAHQFPQNDLSRTRTKHNRIRVFSLRKICPKSLNHHISESLHLSTNPATASSPSAASRALRKLRVAAPHLALTSACDLRFAAVLNGGVHSHEPFQKANSGLHRRTAPAFNVALSFDDSFAPKPMAVDSRAIQDRWKRRRAACVSDRP